MSLADARRLCDNATPGPWQAYNETTEQGWCFATEIGVPKGDSITTFDGHNDADAEFIAAARTLIPWLLDRIDQLTQAGDEIAARLLAQDHFEWPATNAWDEARAALEENA